MDNRVMWAVRLWAQMKDQRDDFGNLITETLTVHVVTDKGYQAAVDAAVKDVGRTWDVEVKGVEEVGVPPLIV